MRYEGLFSRGKRCGMGSLKLGEKLVYRGMWKDDVFNGRGVLFWLNNEEH